MSVSRDPVTAALERLSARDTDAHLSADESHDAVSSMLDGSVPEALVASLLTALHLKGETPEELLGAVRAIRSRMVRFDTDPEMGPCLDTCGTGGDRASTVNISTAAAVVVAACGVPVVKHGNRAASGSSGSSDVLDRLGITIEAKPETLLRCLRELRVAFLFAPAFHPGLRAVASVRRQLPFRTLFNLVGPLCNPARPAFQLVGVPGEVQAERMAHVLARTESIQRALVVTGSDGLDEVTLDGPTSVRVVQRGQVWRESWSPASFDLPRVRAAELAVSGPEESAERLKSLFAGENGAVRAIVLANSAAALWAVEPCDLRKAVARAGQAIDSGAAARIVERWGRLTRCTVDQSTPDR